MKREISTFFLYKILLRNMSHHLKKSQQVNIFVRAKKKRSILPYKKPLHWDCREISNSKNYLSSDLNIAVMYRLYIEHCQKNGYAPVSEHQYRRIFSTEYNYSFHVPKKDQCLQCFQFSLAKNESRVDEALQSLYDEHLARKQACQEAKTNDKIRAESDPSFRTVTFDLQKVLQLPSSPVSQFYYRENFVCTISHFLTPKQRMGTAFFGTNYMAKEDLMRLDQ